MNIKLQKVINLLNKIFIIPGKFWNFVIFYLISVFVIIPVIHVVIGLDLYWPFFIYVLIAIICEKYKSY